MYNNIVNGGEEKVEYTYGNEDLSFSKYLSKCFLWMFLGLLATFATAAFFSYTGLFITIFANMGIMFTLVISIVEIVLVISVSRVVFKLDTKKALGLFFAYSVINGITLASIFYLYDLTSIIYTFLATAGVFGAMAFIGYTTKLDLSKLGTFLSIGLIGMLIAGIILMFAFNEKVYAIYSIFGIALFMLITAYDIHIIKRMYYHANTYEQRNALSIYGALQLYLDFINIFIRLLALFARNRD